MAQKSKEAQPRGGVVTIDGTRIGDVVSAHSTLIGVKCITAPTVWEIPCNYDENGFPTNAMFTLVDSGITPPRLITSFLPLGIETGNTVFHHPIPFEALKIVSIPTGSTWEVTTG